MNQAPKTLAQFKLHDQHTVTLQRTTEGHSVTCDTCSVSASIAAAAQFMHAHKVHSMTIDGTPLQRI